MSEVPCWVAGTRDGERVVVVELGSPSNPHWYVICPAAATLVLDTATARDYAEDCMIGAECDWSDLHRAATDSILRRAALSATDPGSGQ